MAHIENVLPDAVSLNELRAGDCFQDCTLSGWVLKLVERQPEQPLNVEKAVVLNSGEILSLDGNEKVYPLIEPNVGYKYDFEREFESGRDC